MLPTGSGWGHAIEEQVGVGNKKVLVSIWHENPLGSGVYLSLSLTATEGAPVTCSQCGKTVAIAKRMT